MPRHGKSTLADLIASDSENDFQMPTPDSANENMAQAKKGRGRPKTTAGGLNVMKASARHESPARAVTKKRGRPALVDKTNEVDVGNESEQADFDLDNDSVLSAESEVDELNESIVVPQPKAARNKKSNSVPTTKGRPRKEVQSADYEITAETSEAPKAASKSKNRVPSAEPKQAPLERVIQETQQDRMELDNDEGVGEEDEAEETTKTQAMKTNIAPRVGSQPRQTSVPNRRAGSVSDTERSEPIMRRKLGDVIKRNETLEMKYNNLREIGIVQAEQKFEQLRKKHEKTTKASDALIAHLKSQLQAQELQLKESRSVKKQVEKQTSEIAKLHGEVAKLTETLSESQLETKKLAATLAAKRVAASTVESANTRIPGSAVKPGAIRMVGSQEAAEAAEKASLKEDLYSDLTGLLIRSVKRDAEEDVYDCIQTGRNGTLHFKLAIGNEKVADCYDDAQCAYVPLLDPSRDRELMDLLDTEADYLVDEISFPRPQAAKFYAKVAKALTEKKA